MRPVLRSLTTPLEREDAWERCIGRLRGGWKLFVVLVRLFFGRLFVNDNIAFPDQKRQHLISLLALFALISGHLSNVVFFKYALVKDQGGSWLEKSFFMFFVMLLMGLVAILEWDVILLDRRDFSCLIPLPVPAGTLFAAKFTSLLLLAGLFAAAMNAVSVFVAWFYLAKWRSTSPLFGIRHMFAHSVALGAAVLFTFLLAALFIGSGPALLGRRLFARMSVYIRGVMLLGLIVLLASFLVDPSLFIPALDRFAKMKAEGGGKLFLYPFLWFTGVYETLLGTTDPAFLRWARIGGGALAAVAAAFFLVSFLGYRRGRKAFGQSESDRYAADPFRKWGDVVLNALLLRSPRERAVYLFIRTTLQRSLPHRMRIAAWTVGGLGLVFVLFLADGGRRLAIDSRLMSASVMAILFLMLGLRSAVRMPVSPGSRWIFRMTEMEGTKLIRRTLIKTAALRLALPASVGVFLLFHWSGGEASAGRAALYGFGVALVLLNTLFFDLRAVPFACLSRPGREKLHIFWLVYLVMLVAYVRGFTVLGEAVTRDWGILIGFLAAVSLAAMILGAERSRLFPAGNRLVFEEPPDPVMLGLGREPTPE